MNRIGNGIVVLIYIMEVNRMDYDETIWKDVKPKEAYGMYATLRKEVSVLSENIKILEEKVTRNTIALKN